MLWVGMGGHKSLLMSGMGMVQIRRKCWALLDNKFEQENPTSRNRSHFPKRTSCMRLYPKIGMDETLRKHWKDEKYLSSLDT